LYSFHIVTTWKDKAVHSVRKRGVAGTIRHAGALCKSLLIQHCKRYFTRNPWNPWYRFLDRRYDRRFAVDTAGIEALPEIYARVGNDYSPTTRSTFFILLRQLDVDYTNFTFIDFGCGKVKCLLLAAELPFKQVIGIEFSPSLAGVAEDNLKSYRGKRRCSNFQVACTDAGEYAIPDEPAIYYFYDPFVAEVWAKVLENIRHSLATAPREIYIIYLDPSWKALLDEAGFLIPVKQTPLYCIYKTCGVQVDGSGG
jgi:hypothetical protein